MPHQPPQPTSSPDVQRAATTCAACPPARSGASNRRHLAAAASTVQRRSPANTPIQRLIVLDDDMDTSRFLAAAHIRMKHTDQRITTISRAKDVVLAPGEKMYLVAHGDGETHGGRTAAQLAQVVSEWGLHPGRNAIKLISCFSGKEAPEWSYANELALKLRFSQDVTGIKGLETTDDQGHTRAVKMVAPERLIDEAYAKVLDHPNLTKADRLVQQLRSKLAVAKPGTETELVMSCYKTIQELVQPVLSFMDKQMVGLVQTLGKRESEDRMTKLG